MVSTAHFIKFTQSINSLDMMKCQICDYECQRTDNFIRHLGTHSAPDEKKVQCDNCGESVGKLGLKRHRKSVKCQNFKNQTTKPKQCLEIPSVLDENGNDNVKKIKISDLSIEVKQLADGYVSIKHDEIWIDGQRFILMPELDAREYCTELCE